MTKSLPTPKRLAAAGRLAMASALLAVPWFVLAFVFEGAGEGMRAARFAILAGGTSLLVYLMMTLGALVRGRYGYHRADAPIVLLIAANVGSALVGGIVILFPTTEASLGLVGAVLVVLIGILHIVFGARLLRLPDNLQGMLRPFCYLNIATGCLLATVLLLPVGVVTSAIADVMLGTIFLQAAREQAGTGRRDVSWEEEP